MTATQGIHYTIINNGCRWLHFTRAGNAELTREQRDMITSAFWAKKLGDSFSFPESTFEFAETEELNGRIDTPGDGVYEYTEAEEGRIADSQYRERRVREEFEGESRWERLK